MFERGQLERNAGVGSTDCVRQCDGSHSNKTFDLAIATWGETHSVRWRRASATSVPLV
jgi:hypothetical protein